MQATCKHSHKVFVSFRNILKLLELNPFARLCLCVLYKIIRVVTQEKKYSENYVKNFNDFM